MVVLRCISCEECVKLDDDLVEQDEVISPLLDRFVCAGVVSTNGLDLSVFQFDTDQSFAVFFLNAIRRSMDDLELARIVRNGLATFR